MKPKMSRAIERALKGIVVASRFSTGGLLVGMRFGLYKAASISCPSIEASINEALIPRDYVFRNQLEAHTLKLAIMLNDGR